MSDYTNDGQQRILSLLKTLAGNEVTGLLPHEIATAQKCSAAIVTRDLFNLAKAGLAEKIAETGRWRLGPKLVQIAIAFQLNLDRSQARLNEVSQRYTRTPN
jgi:DNA-binding IclR family transcriptional regulator